MEKPPQSSRRPWSPAGQGRAIPGSVACPRPRDAVPNGRSPNGSGNEPSARSRRLLLCTGCAKQAVARTRMQTRHAPKPIVIGAHPEGLEKGHEKGQRRQGPRADAPPICSRPNADCLGLKAQAPSHPLAVERYRYNHRWTNRDQLLQRNGNQLQQRKLDHGGGAPHKASGATTHRE
eukprot:GHVT01067607.1.p2 GENE.GHVT01067607.1~~GHVT01067607.1.p2  ORF type:complete len:177 (-),score=25.82 GHVT01067607.1:155-685(-)